MAIPRFLEALEEVINDEDEARASKPYEFKHNPSSASTIRNNKVEGTCARQLYYKATSEPISNPKGFTTKLQGMFGDGIHDKVLSKLQKSKRFTVIPEAGGKVAVEGLGKEVSFRLDGLVSANGEIGGLELKTMNSFGLQKMVKEGGPKEGHILQVMSYFGTNSAIKWFALVYLGRDTAYRAEYHIAREGDVFTVHPIFPGGPSYQLAGYDFKGIKERWAYIENAILNKEIPSREYKVVFNDAGNIVPSRVKNKLEYSGDWQCSYCAYRNTCWSGPGAKEDSVQING